MGSTLKRALVVNDTDDDDDDDDDDDNYSNLSPPVGPPK